METGDHNSKGPGNPDSRDREDPCRKDAGDPDSKN